MLSVCTCTKKYYSVLFIIQIEKVLNQSYRLAGVLVWFCRGLFPSDLIWPLAIRGIIADISSEYNMIELYSPKDWLNAIILDYEFMYDYLATRSAYVLTSPVYQTQ